MIIFWWLTINDMYLNYFFWYSVRESIPPRLAVSIYKNMLRLAPYNPLGYLKKFFQP